MSKTLKRDLWLDCGCCGLGFKTWNGYQDQDQDQDYGICSKCQEIVPKTEKFYEDSSQIIMDLICEEKKDKVTASLERNKHYKYALVNWCLNGSLEKWGVSKGAIS